MRKGNDMQKIGHDHMTTLRTKWSHMKYMEAVFLSSVGGVKRNKIKVSSQSQLENLTGQETTRNVSCIKTNLPEVVETKLINHKNF